MNSQDAGNDRPEPRRATRWAVVLPAMALPCVAALLYFVWLSGHDAAKAIYALTKVWTVAWPFLAVGWILKRPIKIAQGNLRHHLRSVPLGLISGLVIAALMAGLMTTPMAHVIWSSKPAMLAKVQALGVLEHYWLFGAFLAVVHSLIEEVYWRWFVWGQLRRLLNPAWAHVLAGAAFAAHHVVVTCQYFPILWGIALGAAVGLGGVLWSVMVQRQRSLLGIWISHLIVDFAILSIGAKILL